MIIIGPVRYYADGMTRSKFIAITTNCIATISMAEPETSRFQLVDDDGLKDFVSKIDSENTRKQVKYSLNIFGEYLEATHYNLDSVEKMPNSELDEVLAKFYVSSRQKNGSLYCKKSMMAIRFGLQRHFLSSRKVDIIKNEDFIKSKRIFKSFTATLKRRGKRSSIKLESIDQGRTSGEPSFKKGKKTPSAMTIDGSIGSQMPHLKPMKQPRNVGSNLRSKLKELEREQKALRKSEREAEKSKEAIVKLKSEVSRLQELERIRLEKTLAETKAKLSKLCETPE